MGSWSHTRFACLKGTARIQVASPIPRGALIEGEAQDGGSAGGVSVQWVCVDICNELAPKWAAGFANERKACVCAVCQMSKQNESKTKANGQQSDSEAKAKRKHTSAKRKQNESRAKAHLSRAKAHLRRAEAERKQSESSELRAPTCELRCDFSAILSSCWAPFWYLFEVILVTFGIEKVAHSEKVEFSKKWFSYWFLKQK